MQFPATATNKKVKKGKGADKIEVEVEVGAIANAKTAIGHIEALGHKVTATLISGAWYSSLSDADVVALGVQTLRTWGRNHVHAMLDPAEGSEDLKETPDSIIVIEYEETPESIAAAYDAEMERVEAEIDGEATDAVDLNKAIGAAALSGFAASVESGDVDSGVDPIDQTDPGGIDAATQAVEAARGRKVTPTDNDDGYP